MDPSKEAVLSKALIPGSESGGVIKNQSFSKYGGTIFIFCLHGENFDSLGIALRASSGLKCRPSQVNVCTSAPVQPVDTDATPGTSVSHLLPPQKEDTASED